MSQNVLSLDLKEGHARQLISEIIKDSSRISFSIHARKRMRQRKISITQILCCLKHGIFIEKPYRDIKTGDWKMTLEQVSAGDVIKVAMIFQKNEGGETILIVTVI